VSDDRRGWQSWDDRWLPRAAATTQRGVAALRRRLDRWHGPGTLVGDGVRAQPALAGSAIAVFVAGLVLAVAGGPGGPPADTGTPQAVGPVAPVPVIGTTLGPTPGTSVASYLTKAQADLRHFGEVARGRPGYAVVDLRGYLTRAQTERVFGPLSVVRAYVHVPAKALPTQVHAIPLQGTFAPLTDGMLASGRLAAATAKTFQVLVTQLTPSTPRAGDLKRRYSLQEHASGYEGERLQHPATCACVFAVVVDATPVQLAVLARSPQVRVVDVAPPGADLDALTIFPLEPEITGVVPKGGLFGA
jgi:hypothetical protein